MLSINQCMMYTSFVSSFNLFYLTRFYWENHCLQILLNPVAPNSYLGLSALSKNFFGLYKIWQGRQLFAKTFWTHCEFSLESLNFVAFMKPNKHKMRSEDFLQLGRICFRILLRQSENFSDFCKVLSQFAFRNMIVPLPKSQTRHPARAQAPLPLPVVYRLLLWYCTSMLWWIDTCQIKVSADQYHVTISRAQVYSSRSRVFFWSWPLTKCWFSIRSWAHIRLTYWSKAGLFGSL